MGVKIAYFSSLVFAGLAMAPSFAHLLELLNKIGLPRDEYFVVQQIYRGWALLGVVIFSALLSTLILTIMLRRRGMPFILALIAFLAIFGTQAIFWTYTQPANTATDNWTTLPQNWEILRRQWEYSHAASAGLNFVAFVALVLSLLVRDSWTE
jgi:ABC-type branched-subunit amino acid transport system permease subunit